MDFMIFFDYDADAREWLRNGGKQLFLGLFKDHHWELFREYNYDLREIRVEADADAVEEFERAAEKIDGWNTGLPYAPHPVIITEE